MATNIKPDELREKEKNMEAYRDTLVETIEVLVTNMRNASNALNGTTYSIAANVENAVNVINNTGETLYGCIVSENQYLLKKIGELETESLQAGEKLKAAIDCLAGIWDTVDTSTWSSL